MTSHPVEGQWLDFYALLGVPVNADEDTIRKRIGKVYSEAAANSDHRDLARRHYFQALVERVLPQCRRVLLDPEWRAKYDRQHILNSIGDPSSQDYVTFIGSMRGKDAFDTDLENLPQRIQDDIKAAHAVVECARQGTELDLLPSTAVSSQENHPPAPNRDVKRARGSAAAPFPAGAPAPAPVPVPEPDSAPRFLQAAVHRTDSETPAAPSQSENPRAADSDFATPAPVEEPVIEGEAVRAKVITAQEAAEIRRRRASNPDTAAFVKPTHAAVSDGSVVIPQRKGWKAPVSRVIVEELSGKTSRTRLLSSTSMNLMVAIVGVLLTITIQKFASTPAVATNVGRTPIFVTVASEMEGAMLRAESGWEKTPDGANFDLVVQAVDSRDGMRRALGQSAPMPDVWIPSASMWVNLYNDQAGKFKREPLTSDQSIAQTPMVLIARSEHATVLHQRFPNHQIPSWNALRMALIQGAPGHFGLTDPQKATTGAMARFSMAREWAASQNQSPAQAAKNPLFWKWMSGFEDNSPSSPSQTSAMVKDLVLGTTGRYWWGIAYESDALKWMGAGKPLEIFYLPRTTLADHPFCPIERVGAPLEVAQARASFEKYLRSTAVQKDLLESGFRPNEVSLKTKTKDNPFLNPGFRARGARTENLPLDERPNSSVTETIMSEWGKRFG